MNPTQKQIEQVRDSLTVEPVSTLEQRSAGQMTRQRIRALGRNTAKHQIAQRCKGMSRKDRRKIEREGCRIAWRKRDKEVVERLTHG